MYLSVPLQHFHSAELSPKVNIKCLSCHCDRNGNDSIRLKAGPKHLQSSNMASSASSVFNLGNGLIEISALTSMIGSGTALRLALGNKGPGGFVWATMSSFGAMSVVKACLAAVIPAFLLDSLGARSQDVDAVLGYKLDLNKHFDHRNRSAVAKGIEVGHDRVRGFDLINALRDYVHALTSVA